MRVCLFEDGLGDFEPLTWTRPVFDLLCGLVSLGDKQRGCFSARENGVLIRPHLTELYRLEHPDSAVNDEGWLRSSATLLINGRWLPPTELRFAHVKLEKPEVACVGHEVAYALVPPDQLNGCTFSTLHDFLDSWKRSLPCRQTGGTFVMYPWDLIQHNGAQIVLDFEQAGLAVSHSRGPISVVGPTKHLYMDATADIDPAVVADTRNGPVVIDKHSIIQAFTRLEGPCRIGPHTHIKSAQIHAGTTVGPHCRIGGEIEESIVQGYSNKAHDGFLGHSYLGEWVNFGAGTQTSDLRNDYGKVTVSLNGRRIPTGLIKVGSFVGDHTKTGLGTLLNTGSTIGLFCNLLPAGTLAPTLVPSFTTWWKGEFREGADLQRLLSTAKAVMERRHLSLTDKHCAVYQHVWNATAAERRQALLQIDHRLRRQSA